MRALHWLFVWVSVILSSCTVGPKYEEPSSDIDYVWHSPLSEGMDEDSPACFHWWQSLNDPLLSCLIEEAALQNLDLSMAATRLLIAREELKGGSASLLPHIDGSVSYDHVRFNRHLLKEILGRSGPHNNIDFFTMGFDAQWEFDLFGKTKHDLAALQAQIEASEHEFTHVWITLLAEVARYYVELRGLQLRLELLNKNVAEQRDHLTLTQGLMQTGFISDIDQAQAQTQLSSLLAQKPQIELQIMKTTHRLSILLGYKPGELFARLCEPSSLPNLPCQMPIGIPSELLRRRPDIMKAERELAAATEKVGSAIAALFPRLSLRGFIGDLSNFSCGSFTWLGGSQLLLPIFNSKLLEQDVNMNKINVQQACLNYQKTVLEALEETENGIASFKHEWERNKHLKEAKQSSQEAYTLTWQLYQGGFKNYLEVQQNKQIYFSAEEVYLQSQVELLLNYIALYKALGGGWECSCCDNANVGENASMSAQMGFLDKI